MASSPDGSHRRRPVAVVQFPRLGPYHAARLEAAGRRGDVIALETAPGPDEYIWETAGPAGSFSRERLTGTRRERLRELGQTLARLRPDAVALCGWSDAAALAGLRFCLASATPAIVMSESLPRDRERPWRRWLKGRLVRSFGAGLVGGAAHADYLAALGLSRERIFTGYDVVDNDHFVRGSDAARQAAGAERRARELPERYFLACQRLMPAKNLPVLLEAFALYRRRSGAQAWDLVVAGDGPLRSELQARVERGGLRATVRFLGALGYRELPAVYGLAGALVLASTFEPWGLVVNEAMAAALPVLVSRRCGSAAELVRDGHNGFTFDPASPQDLADALQRLADAPDARREAMGRAARATIAAWTPEAFAEGLWSAAARAERRPADRLSAALLGALALR